MQHIIRRLQIFVLWLVVLLSVFSYSWIPLRSSQDEWWHLKTGLWIVEHGTLPVYDLFTYTGSQTVWHNHEWLSQIIFWLIYDHCGGLFGLITFKSLWLVIVFAGVVWLAYRRCGEWIVALVLGWVAAEIARRGMTIRPPLFSYAFFALYLGLFDAWKRSSLRSWILAAVTLPLMILWTNLHGMSLLGIVVAGSYALGESIEFAWQWHKGMRPRARRVAFLWGMVVALTLMVCCNPSGWNILFLGGKFMNDPYLKKAIGEMLPPPFFFQETSDGFTFVPGFLAFWLSLPLLLSLLLFKNKLPCLADLIIVLFFAVQGALHWRLLPFYAIAVIGPAAWLVVNCLPSDPKRRAWTLGVFSLLGVLGAITMTAVIGEPPPQSFLKRNILLARGETKDRASYPDALLNFIERADLPDNMLSPVNYCGYFIWKLSPEKHKLFTDNRFDIWGSKWWLQHEVMMGGSEKNDNILGRSWSELLDANGIRFVVIERSSGLQKKLEQERFRNKWVQVYYWIPPRGKKQDGFSVWVRNDGTDTTRAKIVNAQRLFKSDNPGAILPQEFEQ